jgi:D-proline reductase (dithiol) PrdB
MAMTTPHTVDPFKYLSPASTAVMRSWIAGAPRGPVPWAPLQRPLEEATVALVSTAAIALRSDPPFDAEGERRNPWWGDPSHRVLPATATARDVRAWHLHIETAYLEDDLDVALPLARLGELVSMGLVGRSAPSHYSFMGYLLDPTEFLASTVPAMVAGMQREGVDAAVFVPV